MPTPREPKLGLMAKAHWVAGAWQGSSSKPGLWRFQVWMSGQGGRWESSPGRGQCQGRHCDFIPGGKSQKGRMKPYRGCSIASLQLRAPDISATREQEVRAAVRMLARRWLIGPWALGSLGNRPESGEWSSGLKGGRQPWRSDLKPAIFTDVQGNGCLPRGPGTGCLG